MVKILLTDIVVMTTRRELEEPEVAAGSKSPQKVLQLLNKSTLSYWTQEQVTVP
jgi:hypothetical protein